QESIYVQYFLFEYIWHPQYPTMRWNCSTYCGPLSIDAWKGYIGLNGYPTTRWTYPVYVDLLRSMFGKRVLGPMHISSGITQYLRETTFTKWTVHKCLEFLAENCAGVTSEHREEIMAELKHQLHLISTHNSMNKKAQEKATKLFNNVERYFQFKEVTAFFDQMDKKLQANENLFDTKTNLYGSEVAVQMIDAKLSSFQSEISSVSNVVTTSATEHDSEKKEHESFVNVEETADEAEYALTNPDNNQIVSETIQTSSSAQAYDQEADDEEIDKIIVNKISDLLLSNLNLEEIWIKVMERLKKENLRVQSIESRIVDLSNWTKVDWNRILKTSDYVQLFNESRKKLYKDKIDKEVQNLLRDGCGRMKSLNDLILWKDKFTTLESEDARLTVGIIEFFHLCLRREVNILVMQHRERDYIVKILSPIIGFIFEEFDIGTFELNWIEKDSRSVTCRKRKFVHEEYVNLDPPTKKMDLVISLRSYKVELLVLEAGNTEGPMDDTKFREDHSKIKVVMKDCLDAFWSKLHFRKDELEEVFAMGIQITGTKWTIYSLTYNSSKNFYFFVEMATLTLPTTLSDMEDLLPSFLENLLALRHTQIDLVAKIRKFTQKKNSTPSPPSSPLHETTETPSKKQKLKQDPFYILDNLY
ncbi:11066_t:CDS:10, partial [Ambispora gerdemannii]